ncbi:hypothetical protein [Shewanella algae]|uniref:hypothetical protein n=1 Tax=Shewanella algae TaxID=38313 RepID=UPI001AAEC0B6|nr:hypothetical protein [Shewanella algae]MBO2589350.1 hypothetical protein [Shewanella algae]
MKVFAMNECDWMVGESLEDCIQCYVKDFGGNESIYYPCELDGEQLDASVFIADENGDLSKRTFKEQLAIEVDKGGVFPRLFASTEY